ncbi:MAG: FixH family protein [Bauldia sp.]|nr:FixH family protein [Bauldia sp.]
MGIRHFLKPDDDHPFTGYHMLALVLLFFGTIIAVNIVMAVAATSTFPGLVVENSYVASQHYNETLAEDRAREQSGWKADVAAPGGVIAVRIVDRDGLPLRSLAVTVAAGRPSTVQEDRTLELFADGDGYRAGEALPEGLWDLAVEARDDGRLVFGARQRLQVKAGGPG